MSDHLITLMVLFPVAGVLFQAVMPSVKGVAPDQLGRWVAIAASLAASVCAIALIFSMQSQTSNLQASELMPWVGSYAISYAMAIDGLSALPVLLVALLFPILIAAEWNQKTGRRGMHALFLLLQTSLFGALCAQDLFLQFFFWGLAALPFYFLIGIWGEEGREKAAFRSIIAAAVGNALVFAALVLIYYSVDPHSFSLHELAGGRLAGKTFALLGQTFPVSTVAFVLISAGLGLRAPVWPFHGWFTSVAEEAPFSAFVALSAATIPVALYIFVRLTYSLFPEMVGSAAKFVVAVGAINLFLGGICAVKQRGLRLLLAYLCVSGVGIVILGIGSLNSAGLVGAVYQQLILGIGLAGFGLFSGVISERAGHSMFLIENGERGFGGIATRAPAVAVVAGVVVASLVGFPGFAGFVGNSLVMIGSYTVHPATVILVAGALVLAAYYLLTMYKLVFLGKSSAAIQSFPDLTLRERAYFFPLVAGLLVFGLYPKPLIELVRPTVLTLLSTVK